VTIECLFAFAQIGRETLFLALKASFNLDGNLLTENLDYWKPCSMHVWVWLESQICTKSVCGWSVQS